MSDSRLERQYKKLLEAREKNVAQNAAEGRTMNMSGTPLNDTPETAGTLGDVMDTMKRKGASVTNLENTIKSTPKDLVGITPDVAYKSRFADLKNKLSGVTRDLNFDPHALVEEASPAKNEVINALKSQRGSSGILPALGIGALGLGALGIAQKAQAGEYGKAGLETADLGTDLVPVLGEVKMALRPSEAGNAELPPEEMVARNQYNEMIRKSKEGQPARYPAEQQPLIEPEERAKYDELKRKFNLDFLKQ